MLPDKNPTTVHQPNLDNAPIRASGHEDVYGAFMPTPEERERHGTMPVTSLREHAAALFTADPEHAMRLTGMADALHLGGYGRLGETFEDWGWSLILTATATPSASTRQKYGPLDIRVLYTMGDSWPDMHPAKVRSVSELAAALEREGYAHLAETPDGWTYSSARSGSSPLAGSR